MAHLHIIREHSLGLEQARKIAFAWAEQVEEKFGMDCVYEEDDEADVVSFTRSGVVGTLHVSATRFELDARLGFLLGAFKDRIESEIVKNLDELLKPKAVVKAPAKATAKSAAKTAAKTAVKTPAKTPPVAVPKKRAAKKSST